MGADSTVSIEIVDDETVWEPNDFALDDLSFASPVCLADLDGSGAVDLRDLGILLADFGCGT